MRQLRYLLWALVAFAAVGFGTLYYWSERQAEPPPMAVTPMSNLGGRFILTGTDGKPFDSSSLAGKPYAIFFGFTNCPDVCPTTLARLVRLRQQVGGDESFAILFVSVDPERDTPATMLDYVRLFNSPVIGLTGSPEQIAQVKKQFGAYSEKVPGENGSYTVDHTATTLLFDRSGRFQSTIAADEGNSAALDKLKRLTGNS